MRSLDKLRKMDVFVYDEDIRAYRTADMDWIANEIEDEIDEWYLPRPLFEDGEPVQFGDEFLPTAIFDTDYCGSSTVKRICITDRGNCTIGDDSSSAWIPHCARFRRPTEQYTQGELDGVEK